MRWRSSLPLTAVAVAAALTLAPVPPAAAATQLVVNGTFGNGTSPWWNTGDTTMLVEAGQLRVDVPDGTANPWDAVVAENDIALTSGRSYTLSFDAAASRDITVTATVQRAVSPYETELGQDVVLGVGTPRHYSYTFNSNLETTQGQVGFQLGKRQSETEGRPAFTFWLDNVTLIDNSSGALVTIDFNTVVRELTADAIGTTVTGYGNQHYITNNDRHRGYVQRLAPRVMRIELAYLTPGDPTSRVVCGGSYCDTAIDGSTWIGAIRDLGAEPMVILPLDGRHAAEIDVTDAVNLYRYVVDTTGTPVRRFIVGNETDNSGNPKRVTADEYSRRFNLVADALRVVDPDVRMAGPGTASYNTAYLDTFLAGSGSKVDVVDFHKYAQGGEVTKSDAQLLSETDEYRTVPADLRQRIRNAVPARADQIGIQIGEYNLDWDNDPRQATGFTTVWSAAALGNMLSSGVTAIQYGDKNGDLGLTTQDRPTPDEWDVPLPIYHGIGMFTGEALFRPFGRTMVATTSDDPRVAAFASLDSTSVVLVNTATVDRPTSITLDGLTASTAQLWQSTDSNLTPHQVTGPGVTANQLTLTLPARSVSTVLIEPDPGLRAAYHNTTDLTGPAVHRIDPQLNFDWGLAAPAPGINADGFSVRWTGGVLIPVDGGYTFTTTSDDGTRLWIDDTLVVSAWSDHSTRDDSGTITLGTGWHRIRMEYYDSGYDAVAKLSWEGPGLARQVIPAANLRQSG